MERRRGRRLELVYQQTLSAPLGKELLETIAVPVLVLSGDVDMVPHGRYQLLPGQNHNPGQPSSKSCRATSLEFGFHQIFWIGKFLARNFE